MTEKRFTIHSYNDCIVEDNWTGEDFLIDELCKQNAKKLCNLLNELYEKNQQLKDRITFLEEFITSGVGYTYFQNICDENKQLKQQLQSILKLIKKIEDCTHDMKLIGDLND